MENPSKTQRKKKKKDGKPIKKKSTPTQIISQKVIVNVGDKVKAKKSGRKKVNKKPIRKDELRQQIPQFIYPTNPSFDLVVGQLTPPPQAPLKPPVQVPQFTQPSLNEQVASQVDIPSRKELKAKEKVPVSFEKINDPNKETAYDRVRPQLGVGRDLLNEVVDEMMKDVAKQQLVEPSVESKKKEEKIDVVVFDPRTKPLVPQGQSRFSNITPQEYRRRAEEVKERVDKRSQPLQTSQLFGSLGGEFVSPFTPFSIEKSVFRDIEPESKQLIGSFLVQPTLGQGDVASAILGSADETKEPSFI